MDNKERIETEHFDKINRLPIDQRLSNVFPQVFFKLFSEMCPQYTNDIYKTTSQNPVTRNFSLKHLQPLRTKALSQKYLSYLLHFIWDYLPDDVKLRNNVR